MSAIVPKTRQTLIVTEAVHETAAKDVAEPATALTAALDRLWSADPVCAVFDAPEAVFTLS